MPGQPNRFAIHEGGAWIADPYGYLWAFATHQKDLTAEETRRAGEQFAKEMKQQHGAHA